MKRIVILYFFIITSYLHAHDSGNQYRFIENKGQWDSKILYKADVRSGVLFLEKNCLTYHLIDGRYFDSTHGKKQKDIPADLKINGHAFKVNFLNSNNDNTTEGSDKFDDYFNYYLGKNHENWTSNVSSYSFIKYSNLYNGIDLRVFTQDEKLKYEFDVLPGVSTSSIQMKYDGVSQINLREGNLVIHTSVGDIIEKKPFAYQVINGKQVNVPCQFSIEGNTVSFQFPQGYNKNQKLVIDPTLIFSTYSGSFANNFGYTATFDSEGFLYSGSTAFGIGYPVTLGAYQTTYAGGAPYLGVDIAITKYDTTGTKRIYSTYIGGNSDEMPHSLIVNGDDELFLFGTTSSSNFPTTTNAFDATFGGGLPFVGQGLGIYYENGCDIIISRFNKDGTALLASTYFGGSDNDGLNNSILTVNYADEVRGEIEIDDSNNVYIATCTFSSDFPTTPNAFQTTIGGGEDACVFKLDNSLTTLHWSSFYGGASSDAAYSLELDSLGNIYFAGGTSSSNLVMTSGALYPNFLGVVDGFVAHASSKGDQILHSTYYSSTAYDQIYFVDLDNSDNVFVFGQTTRGNNFIFNAAFSQPNSGQFISKFRPDLQSFVWSTVFGRGTGIPDISPTAFLVDLCSKVYLAGWGGPLVNQFGGTTGLITTPDAFQKTTDNNDFYLFVLEDDASKVSYASFMGGNLSPEHVDGGTSRFDRKGKIYHAVCGGCEGNSDFPIYPNPGAVSPTNNFGEGCNSAVFKMDFNLPIVVADFTAEPGCSGDTIQFINKSLEQKATNFQWFFVDGKTSNLKNPKHVYPTGGDYQVKLIATDNLTCNLGDTLIKMIYISNLPNGLVIDATADNDTIYKGHSTHLHASPNTGYDYTWSPSGSLDDSHNPNPKATPDVTTHYTLTVSDPKVSTCKLLDTVTVNVIEINCDEPYIFIPDAFTPDGDGKNDVLYVRGNNIQDIFIAIYNRWGEKVFETHDRNAGWDGTFKGMKADPGVFDFYIEVTCVDEQKFFKKGNITLIR